MGCPLLAVAKVKLEDGSATICEVQLYLDSFLALKKQAHKAYTALALRVTKGPLRAQ